MTSMDSEGLRKGRKERGTEAEGLGERWDSLEVGTVHELCPHVDSAWSARLGAGSKHLRSAWTYNILEREINLNKRRHG